MTSPVTHDDTVAFFKANNRFGLLEDELVVFCQGTMPAVDAKTGKLLLAAKDSLFLSPDGHGGTVAALAASGAIEHMRQRGIEQLFYLQVDNPLAPICDPEFIGHHLLAESELTSMAVAKQTPQDRLGNFVMIDGRLQVIEYSDFPDDVAERRDAKGGLEFWAGSMAVHVFSATFLERSLALKDSLPFHVARKKVPYVDERGRAGRAEGAERAEVRAIHFRPAAARQTSDRGRVCRGGELRPAEECAGGAEGHARVRAAVHARPAPPVAGGGRGEAGRRRASGNQPAVGARCRRGGGARRAGAAF